MLSRTHGFLSVKKVPYGFADTVTLSAVDKVKIGLAGMTFSVAGAF